MAAAFAAALGKPVQAAEIPRSQWVAALMKQGFSAPAAESMAAMTALTLEQPSKPPTPPLRGATTLSSYISELARSHS